jgi:hypothetical protein
MLLASATLNTIWGVLQLTDNFYFGDSLTRPQPSRRCRAITPAGPR